jgi:hypothetical protein
MMMDVTTMSGAAHGKPKVTDKPLLVQVIPMLRGYPCLELQAPGMCNAELLS